MRGKPKFITFEGTEGSGKSTLIRVLAKRLARLGYSVSLTREPGGHPLSEKIRDLILTNKMNPWTELFLYEASRSEHVRGRILNDLKKGKIVLCDRFTDSSLAYQAFARGLPWKEVRHLNELATKPLKPWKSVFLDLNPAIGLKRATHKNRFEKEGLAFQLRVRRGFLKAIRENPSHWIVIKIKSQSPEALADAVLEKLHLKRRAR